MNRTFKAVLDFGPNADTSKVFEIENHWIRDDTVIYGQIVYDAALTDKEIDDVLMDNVRVTFYPDNGKLMCYAVSTTGSVYGKYPCQFTIFFSKASHGNHPLI